jgi:hypothetical protein
MVPPSSAWNVLHAHHGETIEELYDKLGRAVVDALVNWFVAFLRPIPSQGESCRTLHSERV